MNNETKKYLDILVNEIHSTVIATIDENNKPITRVIDMMLYDDKGLYFLTAKGKEFYNQLQDQKYISLSSIKDKKSITLSGYIKNIKHEKLDEIFEKNTYMKEIYPNDSRHILNVFCLYDAKGQFFDISNPSSIKRGYIEIGKHDEQINGYYINNKCIGCHKCYNVCPQKCINKDNIPYIIDQNRCIHCGLCIKECPKGAIEFIK